MLVHMNGISDVLSITTEEEQIGLHNGRTFVSVEDCQAGATLRGQHRHCLRALSEAERKNYMFVVIRRTEGSWTLTSIVSHRVVVHICLQLLGMLGCLAAWVVTTKTRN